MQEYFPDVEIIPFKGEKSTDLLSYRYYEKERVVLGKPMKDWLKIAVAYWHSFGFFGSDPFGNATIQRAWEEGRTPQIRARKKADAAFEFFTKLGAEYFCFHDLDIAWVGDTFLETLDAVRTSADYLMQKMQGTNIKVLWGTANLFTHPRYMAGAFTNPDPEVFALAAAQAKNALDVTKELGGENFVFWGGREGYDTLFHTNIRKETEHMARFFHMICDYREKIGFSGKFFLEPKPCEPTKHQYDFDCATTHAFLLKYGLEKEFLLNVEANHATLAKHSFAHEIAYALAHDLLGSIDANRGDPELGWDTDQFPVDIGELSYVMYLLLKKGEPLRGGCNFDAKVRRQSVDALDLFYAHISGIDLLAKALLTGEKILQKDLLGKFLEERYGKWDTKFGRDILTGEMDLTSLSNLVHTCRFEPKPSSGKQEMLEAFLQTML